MKIIEVKGISNRRYFINTLYKPNIFFCLLHIAVVYLRQSSVSILNKSLSTYRYVLFSTGRQLHHFCNVSIQPDQQLILCPLSYSNCGTSNCCSNISLAILLYLLVSVSDDAHYVSPSLEEASDQYRPKRPAVPATQAIYL